MAKVTGGVTTYFIYDTQYRVIEERDDSESLLATYTYGRGMDEPLTMECGGQTYYYHRDALGSVTEVSDVAGAIVERYEYDVYGEATIFDGSENSLTTSAIGNPYLFTGRRYDAESDNYYYRARVYSHKLGRFLSQDPLGFDAGDYNLYRYVFNSPTNAVDPTGEFAFLLPWLTKAAVEAGVDALMQATFNYFFDPSITTVGEAFGSIDWKQVAWAGATGLLPGGGLGKAAIVAVGDVLIAYLNALSRCEVYTPEQALFDFAFGVASELVGEALGNVVAKHGKRAVAAGLRRLGLDEAAEKLLRQADEVIDDAVPSPNICSFSEETLVATDEGYVAISDVEIGDYVLAYDEVTGEIGYYPVTVTWAHEDPVIVYLTIDGETIETTPEHPFYTTDGEWIPAGELQAGSEVYKADGSYGVVENVAFVYQFQPMYNLTVAAAHTYFVGNNAWLVHNSCPRPGYSGPPSGYTNLRPHDLNTELGLQRRMTIEDMFATSDYARSSTLLGAPESLRGTNKYIYVVDDMDNIWVARASGVHHADLVGGANVYGAGEMYIDHSGQFRLIDDGSGHYRPEGTKFFSYLKSLMRSKGITFDPGSFNTYGG